MVNVKPDSEMPVDEFGNRADMIMDPTSIPGRMNPSNLYEQYFSGMSRKIRTLVRHEVNILGGVDKLNNVDIERIFNIVLDGIKLFGTEQYDNYLTATEDEKLDIINEISERECYIYYKISSTQRPYEVVVASIGTPYEPDISRFIIPVNGKLDTKWSSGTVMIAPQYIILLAKTPEHYLTCASAKTNHFDLPVSVGPRMRQNIPYRNSPVKILSETETRMYAAYVGTKGLAEMKDRANSVDTHRLVYSNILKADNPSDIEALVDRHEHPFGTDKSIELAESILNVSGISLKYVDEDK